MLKDITIQPRKLEDISDNKEARYNLPLYP